MSDSIKPLNLELAMKVVASPRHQMTPTMQEQAVHEITALRERVKALEGVTEALKWALPLAERAVDDHRMERIRCGHSDIVGTYSNGQSWVGIHQSEVDQIEKARVAYATARALGEQP